MKRTDIHLFVSAPFPIESRRSENRVVTTTLPDAGLTAHDILLLYVSEDLLSGQTPEGQQLIKLLAQLECLQSMVILIGPRGDTLRVMLEELSIRGHKVLNDRWQDILLTVVESFLAGKLT